MQLSRPGSAAAAVLLSALFLSCSQPAATPTTPASAEGDSPAAAGAPPTSGGPSASAPIFRLPDDVRPTRQRVEIEVVPDRERFSGRVEIELELKKSRGDLWVSARELDLTRGTLTAAGKALALRFEKDDTRGAARVVLPERVGAGKATLVIEYSAPFNSHLVGLYRVKSGDRWYAYTQFEAIDARRAFPCFDEPAFKIPWEVALTVPKGSVAVSNMPVADEKQAGELKRVSFLPSRPLSSYLVAIAVGDFDVVTPPPLPPNEVRARPLQVRGLATKGRGKELEFALKSGGELLVMLERWFGTEFPYPKLDHIAVPDFEYGAMENAGLITYREPLLLVEPKTAAEDQKRNVASVMTHEIAHQWYGDLVTMAWWDDLWLNESFADFMAAQITAAWKPEYRIELTTLKEVHGAMQTDELSTVRPIRPDLRVEGDIFGFDYQIAYNKGSSVVAMFEQFLGEDAFRTGLRQYLARHADGNATRDDLVTALSAGGADIRQSLRSFIDQPGIPLIQATLRCEDGPPRVALSQSRNLPLGSTASRDQYWSVPVCVRAAGARKQACMLLDKPDAEMPLENKVCPAWILPNPGAQGYYRWSLPPDQLRGLLTRGYRHLTAAERLSLASNLRAGLRSGALPAGDVLAALRPLARDAEPAVAQEPGALLETVREYIVEPSQREAVEVYMRSLYAPALARLGWKARPGEPFRVQTYRRWVIGYLAFSAMDRKVLERAAALGRAYLGTDGKLHPEAVDPDLVAVVLPAAARLGTPEMFDTMLERLVAEDDFNVRENLLSALSHFTDPQLAERARALAFDDRLRVNERASILSAQAGFLELRPGAWAWALKNFDRLAPKLPPAYVQFMPFLQGGCSEEAVTELQEKLAPRLAPYPGAPYMLTKVMEATRLCAAQVAAQRKSASEFFARKR